MTLVFHMILSQVLLYYPLYDALMAEAQKRQHRIAATDSAISSIQSSRSDSSRDSRSSDSRDSSIASIDSSSNSNSKTSSSPGVLTPMACGAAARIVAVFAVAPLELARTRQQVRNFS